MARTATAPGRASFGFHETSCVRQLKSDLFGSIWRQDMPGRAIVIRDVREARWWLRSLARALCRREARALAALDGLRGTPRLVAAGPAGLAREWIEGRPMQTSRPRNAAYYRQARRLLVALHRLGVAHNDLAKEPNWLVTPTGAPAIVDFQLALVSRRRGRLFRILAREDHRHLLKHKRTYCPERLTARERRMLANPAAVSRIWMATGKPVYMLVTRRVFGWADREGAHDRGFTARGHSSANSAKQQIEGLVAPFVETGGEKARTHGIRDRVQCRLLEARRACVMRNPGDRSARRCR